MHMHNNMHMYMCVMEIFKVLRRLCESAGIHGTVLGVGYILLYFLRRRGLRCACA